MSFNDNIRLDPSRVSTSGAGRKVAAPAEAPSSGFF